MKISLSPSSAVLAPRVQADLVDEEQVHFLMSKKATAEQDFGSLYSATITPLRRYLGRLLGSSSEAQDVAHDAYLRMYRMEEKTAPDNPEAYLYVTARRLAINRLKRRQISPISGTPALVETAPSHAPGVAQQVMARQELSLLEDAMAKLPPGCRAVLLLRKVELLSHQEIADRLGIAISTVEKQHARALRLLRAALPNETVSGDGSEQMDKKKEAQS